VSREIFGPDEDFFGFGSGQPLPYEVLSGAAFFCELGCRLDRGPFLEVKIGDESMLARGVRQHRRDSRAGET
jgi:hypothetical protein